MGRYVQRDARDDESEGVVDEGALGCLECGARGSVSGEGRIGNYEAHEEQERDEDYVVSLLGSLGSDDGADCKGRGDDALCVACVHAIGAEVSVGFNVPLGSVREPEIKGEEEVRDDEAENEAGGLVNGVEADGRVEDDGPDEVGAHHGCVCDCFDFDLVELRVGGEFLSFLGKGDGGVGGDARKGGERGSRVDDDEESGEDEQENAKCSEGPHISSLRLFLSQ